MSTVATGMALGAGSEVGHQAVRSMMGGGSSGHHEPAPQQQQQEGYIDYAQPTQQQQQPMENPCMGFNQNLLSCLQQNRGEINICQNYMDMLNQCERDNMHRTYQ